MDNKLSELSNPAWIVGQQEIADFMRGDEALLVRGYDPESTEPALRMYSQEYVWDLLDRIAELEAKTEMTMGVGSGNGNLFVHGDYDSIKAAQAIVLENESLRAKLATPVRLPRPGFVTCSGERHYTYGADEVKVAIRAAGFTFTVEGDE